MNNTHTFVFFGIVGSGKGTQVEMLQKYLKEKNPDIDLLYVYPGVEFRKIVDSNSYTGLLVKKSLDQGHLQPDFLATGLFGSILVNNIKEKTTLIVDGFPRTIDQAVSFEIAMNFYERNHVHLIYIEVGEAEAEKRMMLRGRHDDTVDGIKKRFDEYIKSVVPTMNYFKNKNGYTIHTINGEQSVLDVHNDIIKSLNQYL